MTNNRGIPRRTSGVDLMLDAVFDNPLVAGAAGVTLIAGGGISLGNALVLTLLMAAQLPLVGIIAAFERERMKPELRPAFYCAMTAVVTLLLSLLLELIAKGSVENLGIYAPLVAVDALVLSATAEDAPYVTPREAAWEALGYIIVFAAIAFPVALVREIIGNGSIFGGWLGFNGLEALRHPFAGFILCGLALAGLRAILTKLVSSGEEVQE